MSTKIFVSLPVTDVSISKRFYEALGFNASPQFADQTTACIVISDTIYIMLAMHEKFKMLTPKEIADPRRICQSLISLSCESRSSVVDLVAKAIAAGGSEAHEPEEHGFMYQHGFYDPDGHGWGVFWMDPAVAEQADQT
ncbi:MAG: glyoxalase/bleomycin resistance/extradiol dioxygenase family protein [Planctomycetes bacterium]|nr:glyoxalase/bleomycin resistance/extradiol dioxygenase family protein [Planctomycetota bacterium]